MKSLAFLNKYLLKYKWRIILGIICITIANIFGVYPAQIIRFAFDSVHNSMVSWKAAQGTPDESEVYSSLVSALFFLGLIVLCLAAARGLFLFFMRQTIIVTSRLIEADLKNEIFQQYQRLTPSFYKMHNTGDLLNRISEDVSRVRMYLGPGIMYTINLVALFVIVTTFMFSVNATFSVYVLLPLPVLITGIYYVSALINKKSDDIQAKLSDLSTITQETFSGIRIIRSFGTETSVSDHFKSEVGKYRKSSLELVKINSVFHPLVLLLISISTLLAIIVGGYQSIQGKVSPGNIAEFVFYVNMLTWPVASVGWVTSLIQRAAASQNRINEFLRIVPEIPGGAYQITQKSPSIEFRNVSFVYPDTGISALRGISFTVGHGKTIGIIGHTGSGKSTIANLMVRLFDVSDGQILINGNDIRDLNITDLRDLFGYVPQDVFLFSETIANNIKFGVNGINQPVPETGHVPGVAEEEIINIGKITDIHDEVSFFPSKYNTMIGERGITLSGGQKQRVALARALIRNPQILILDDCLSSVDTETEKVILSNLKEILREKTALIFTHRISTIISADEILVLDKGKIAEKGTHRELSEQKSIYYRLSQQQLNEGQYTHRIAH